MKKQLILNVTDNGYYLAKLLICALYNRKVPGKLKSDTIEILINCSKIVESRLDIPSLKYSNEQIKNNSKVFIAFPFEKPVYISGDNVFTVNKQRDFKNLMVDICEYLDITVDFALKTLLKQYLLTVQYLNELRIKIEGNTLTLEGAEFFMDSDLVNLITLTTTPTLKLAEMVKNDRCEHDEETLSVIQKQTQLPEYDKLIDIGRNIILFPNTYVPEDIELNTDLLMSITKTSETDVRLTTTHLINLLTYNVVTGECPTFYLPDKDSVRFIV